MVLASGAHTTRPAHNKRSRQSVACDGRRSSTYHSHRSCNQTYDCGPANAASFAEAAIELVLEVGEEAAGVVQVVVGVGGRERVVVAVELGEDVKSVGALRVVEAEVLENVEEFVERGVEVTRPVDAAVEEQTEVGGVLGVAEVVGDETSEGVGLGVAEGLFHALSIGLKHLLQHQLLISISLVNL